MLPVARRISALWLTYKGVQSPYLRSLRLERKTAPVALFPAVH